MTSQLQHDQQYRHWSRFATAYEAVFEPLTDQFADAALAALDIRPGDLCLDIGAGTGGAALLAARRGARVLAIDAAEGMARRIRTRAAEGGWPVRAAVMNAQTLALPPAACDAALSVFGIVLCPDPVAALRETARVVRPGRPVAVVTWTEPQNYELVARLIAAAVALRVPLPPPAEPPAQLRFREESALRGLFSAAGVPLGRIERIEAGLTAPSAGWLAERLAFAPGLDAMLAALGREREAVIARFAQDLRKDRGVGPVALRAVAFLALGQASETDAACGL